MQKFALEILPSSSHEVTSLDSQPVNPLAVGEQTTLAVQVAGAVK